MLTNRIILNFLEFSKMDCPDSTQSSSDLKAKKEAAEKFKEKANQRFKGMVSNIKNVWLCNSKLNLMDKVWFQMAISTKQSSCIRKRLNFAKPKPFIMRIEASLIWKPNCMEERLAMHRKQSKLIRNIPKRIIAERRQIWLWGSSNLL